MSQKSLENDEWRYVVPDDTMEFLAVATQAYAWTRCPFAGVDWVG